MIKRDKNFKFPKTAKRRLATFTDSQKSSAYKKLMIEATIASSIIVKDKKKKEQTKEE